MPTDKAKSGAQLIAEERARQIVREGFSLVRDDRYKGRQLALAAESYLSTHTSPDEEAKRVISDSRPNFDWPWAKKWWKPSNDPIRNLVKAGALIAAEIDRLQRKNAK